MSLADKDRDSKKMVQEAQQSTMAEDKISCPSCGDSTKRLLLL